MAINANLKLKIYAACDHAGLDLKNHVLTVFANHIDNKQVEWVDLGTNNTTSVDYPDYADRIAQALKVDPKAMGLLICGSGQGMAIRANRHRHIRAALCWNETIAGLARAHNDANVLCLGARVVAVTEVDEIITKFFLTLFEGDRHARRVEKLSSDC